MNFQLCPLLGKLLFQFLIKIFLTRQIEFNLLMRFIKPQNLRDLILNGPPLGLELTLLDPKGQFHGPIVFLNPFPPFNPLTFPEFFLHGPPILLNRSLLFLTQLYLLTLSLHLFLQIRNYFFVQFSLFYYFFNISPFCLQF